MPGWYNIPPGSTKSPTGYAYKEEGKWHAGREYPGVERGTKLLQAPEDVTVSLTGGDVYFRDNEGQFVSQAKIDKFKKAKGLAEYSRDKNGNWHGPDGKYISTEDIYNKLKYSMDQVGQGKSINSRRARRNFISGLMDKFDYSESEARRKVKKFLKRKKEIRQRDDISRTKREKLIENAYGDIISPEVI